MHDARLQRGGRIHRRQRFGHAPQAVGDGNEDVIDPAGLQVVEHLHPELGTLGALDPQAQDVARAVGQHAQGQVDGLVAHHRILLDLHTQGIEEDHRVHRLQRARLPGGDFGHDGVGHRADELGRHLHPIALQQEALDLAHRHAARVHGHDLVVEAGEAAFVLGDEHRLEAAGTVARHFDAQWPVACQNGLGTPAIALVAAAGLGLAGAAGVAQVVRHLGAQGALDERLLERGCRFVDRLARHGPGDELVNQFLRNRWQGRHPGGDRRVLHLRLAHWHTCSFSSCYASNTKFRTGSKAQLPDFAAQ
ncbi:hypothetical protein D9M68_642970 [compost metagenome]